MTGPHPPSSEFPFHQAIYEARADIRAIVHAHPVALVAFSICRQTPDTRLFHQAHSVCGQTGFAPYALPGSEQLGSNIAETFKTLRQRDPRESRSRRGWQVAFARLSALRGVRIRCQDDHQGPSAGRSPLSDQVATRSSSQTQRRSGVVPSTAGDGRREGTAKPTARVSSDVAAGSGC